MMIYAVNDFMLSIAFDWADYKLFMDIMEALNGIRP